MFGTKQLIGYTSHPVNKSGDVYEWEHCGVEPDEPRAREIAERKFRLAKDKEWDIGSVELRQNGVRINIYNGARWQLPVLHDEPTDKRQVVEEMSMEDIKKAYEATVGKVDEATKVHLETLARAKPKLGTFTYRIVMVPEDDTEELVENINTAMDEIRSYSGSEHAALTCRRVKDTGSDTEMFVIANRGITIEDAQILFEYEEIIRRYR